ncbi:NEDD8-specific protease 2 [Cytospora mali]|uniref:NEDD8-specific protease 2 n=1 Tax=Cytospora mali TaxID=578113 RepID=A0A194VAR4_CYTMA|nr:NEDD8-specific protease 2 [Valsa mali var. pyri (nom. inval.)]
MPFRDRVARRFGETVSYPASLSPFHPVSISYSPEPRIGTGSGLGLGCNRDRATARHDRRDDTRSNMRSKCCCCSSEGEKIARKALGPQHQITKIIKNGKPQTCRGRRRPLATTGRSSSPITQRSSSRRSTSSSSSSSSCSSRFTARSFHSRVTRASSRLTDENGKQLSPTAPYLSYHDVCLTYEDIKALRSDWLTDNNIAFWEEWLEREILPKYPQARICLLRPSMTYLLMRVDNDPQGIRSALPDMTKVTHIFLPINDAVSRTQPDGSHWSLLLVSKIDGVAFHYDSLGGANNGEGQRAADRLGRLMGMPLRYQSIQDCPQQENGNDCGVFVCILMRHLLVKKLLNANAREKVSMSMSNKMIDALGARKEMIKIIESLRKEGERRRSASPYAKQDGAPRID